jgi:hypothetical protein
MKEWILSKVICFKHDLPLLLEEGHRQKYRICPGLFTKLIPQSLKKYDDPQRVFYTKHSIMGFLVFQ